MQTYTLNASNKVLGRLSTEIACLLMGKNRADYASNRIPEIKVVVANVGGIRVTGKKFHDKKYFSHSGYPGGAKFVSYRALFERDSRLVLEKAVSGMLPKNKLRPRMLKNLVMYKGEAPQRSGNGK